MAADLSTRTKSFGQDYALSPVDQFGTWLSARSLRRHVGDWKGKRVADIGCGHDARITTPLLDDIAHLTVADVALSEGLKAHPNVTAIEGGLPAVLASIADHSVDIMLCMSVLEHLWDDRATLGELRRITAAGRDRARQRPHLAGQAGSGALRLPPGSFARAEIDDHKRYYDPRDLWPLLVRSGLPALAHLLPPAQVRPQHLRRVPGTGRYEVLVSFTPAFLDETAQVLGRIDDDRDRSAGRRASPRSRDRGGRLFILGVGGSAGHASHAVNDFRKICGFEAYAPTDNVSELTARMNDEGWDTAFSEWLEGSRLGADDAVLVFSVGGGNGEKNVSAQPGAGARAREGASARASSAIVGRDGGYTAEAADACVVIPPLFAGPGDAAHRGAVRGGVAPAGRATRRCRSARTKWESRADDRAAGFIVGGAGLHRQPLRRPAARRDAAVEAVTLYDNFSSGREWHFAHIADDPRLHGRARRRRRTSPTLHDAMAGHDAGHPPRLEPRHRPRRDRTRRSTSTRGRSLTHSVVEAMRRAGVPRILYASGSGVYGDLGEHRGARGPRPAACRCRPTAPASWPARR